jgi:hypothetical protein
MKGESLARRSARYEPAITQALQEAGGVVSTREIAQKVGIDTPIFGYHVVAHVLERAGWVKICVKRRRLWRRPGLSLIASAIVGKTST